MATDAAEELQEIMEGLIKEGSSLSEGFEFGSSAELFHEISQDDLDRQFESQGLEHANYDHDTEIGSTYDSAYDLLRRLRDKRISSVVQPKYTLSKANLVLLPGRLTIVINVRDKEIEFENVGYPYPLELQSRLETFANARGYKLVLERPYAQKTEVQ